MIKWRDIPRNTLLDNGMFVFCVSPVSVDSNLVYVVFFSDKSYRGQCEGEKPPYFLIRNKKDPYFGDIVDREKAEYSSMQRRINKLIDSGCIDSELTHYRYSDESELVSFRQTILE